MVKFKWHEKNNTGETFTEYELIRTGILSQPSWENIRQR